MQIIILDHCITPAFLETSENARQVLSPNFIHIQHLAYKVRHHLFSNPAKILIVWNLTQISTTGCRACLSGPDASTNIPSVHADSQGLFCILTSGPGACGRCFSCKRKLMPWAKEQPLLLLGKGVEPSFLPLYPFLLSHTRPPACIRSLHSSHWAGTPCLCYLPTTWSNAACSCFL